MNNSILKCGDITDNYVMHTVFSIAELKNLGIQGLVLERLQTKQFVDLENETFQLQEIQTLEDLELFFNLYLGTIFNKLYTKDEITKYIFEIELPEEFEQISSALLEKEIVLRIQNQAFSTKLTKYNQLLISYLGKYQPNNDVVCFDITT